MSTYLEVTKSGEVFCCHGAAVLKVHKVEKVLKGVCELPYYKPCTFLLLLSSTRRKKVICTTCYDNYDSQKIVVIVEVEWISWRAWSTSVIAYILSPPPHTHSHPSTVPTSPSPNCEAQKLSRRMRSRLRSVFNHTTTCWPTPSERDSCYYNNSRTPYHFHLCSLPQICFELHIFVISFWNFMQFYCCSM